MSGSILDSSHRALPELELPGPKATQVASEAGLGHSLTNKKKHGGHAPAQ